MGSKISIDKYVSRLEDILALNLKNLERVHLESKIPDSITQNIKIWKFHEENSTSKRILSSPISLHNLQNQNFSFQSTECYVVLVVYRRTHDTDAQKNAFVSFPHSMWGIVESYNNLTPRGLENPLSTSELNLEILDSFLLPSHKKREQSSLNFEHMIFVWNGKNSNPLIKSLALSSAYNLEELVEKGGDNLLSIFFSGGVILKDKLKNGKVIQLSSTSNKPHNQDLENEICKISQTIFLFKFLFPLNSSRGVIAATQANLINLQTNNAAQSQLNQQQFNYQEHDQTSQISSQPNPTSDPQQGSKLSSFPVISNSNNSNNINPTNLTNIPDPSLMQNPISSNNNNINNTTNNNNSNSNNNNNILQGGQQFSQQNSPINEENAIPESQFKCFRQQYCEDRIPIASNFYANFIRIPPPKKPPTTFTATATSNYIFMNDQNSHTQDERIEFPHQNNQDFSSSPHQFLPQFNNNNEQLIGEPLEYSQQQQHHHHPFIPPLQQQQIQHISAPQPTQPMATNKKNLISMKPLNLSGLSNPTANNNNNNVNNATNQITGQLEQQQQNSGTQSMIPNRIFTNNFMQGASTSNSNAQPAVFQAQFSESSPSDQIENENRKNNALPPTSSSRTYAEYNLHNGYEKLQTGEPIIKLNIKHGKVVEEPQEKPRNPYKLDLSKSSKDKNSLFINMPLDSAREEGGGDNFVDDEEDHNDGMHHRQQFDDNDNYEMDNEYEHESQMQDECNQRDYGNHFRQDEGLNPLPSHRGASSGGLTSLSVMADLEKQQKKQQQLQNFRQSGFVINTGAIKKALHNPSNRIEEHPDDNDIQAGNQPFNYQPHSNSANNGENEEIYYGYNEEEEANGEILRPNAKIKTFAQKCSEVLPQFLYVSGQDVAYNKEKLKKNGITHIINCARDVCKNMFPEDFVYKQYRLKDTKTENIECVFYDSIHFIEEVAKQNGRVFIHCIQGVSRSISLCIAYIIWKQRIDFQEALMFVKKARDVASPNQGFLVQLINFYKRLYQPYDSITIKPRVWCVSSHQVEQPSFVVAKMLLEGLYSHNMLDPRGIFIIQSSDTLYIWIGNSIPQDRLNLYKEYAIRYLENIQKYENARPDIQICEQGSEPEEFWQMWFESKPEVCYAQNKEWNNWFLEINEEQEDAEGQLYFGNEEDEEEPAEQPTKPAVLLFVYPDPCSKLAVFDYDDLADDSLCVLCRLNDDYIKILIWKGPEFLEPEDTEQFFLDEVIQNNFAHHDLNKIFIQNEIPNQESEEFNDCFSSN